MKLLQIPDGALASMHAQRLQELEQRYELEDESRSMTHHDQLVSE